MMARHHAASTLRAAPRLTTFSTDALTMLAAKFSLKERWRQIFSEAARIEEKHLLTLSPRISVHQTDQMKAGKVQLVVPAEPGQQGDHGPQRELAPSHVQGTVVGVDCGIGVATPFQQTGLEQDPGRLIGDGDLGAIVGEATSVALAVNEDVTAGQRQRRILRMVASQRQQPGLRQRVYHARDPGPVDGPRTHDEIGRAHV